MPRTVSASFVATLSEPTQAVAAVALARDPGLTISEALTITLDGTLVETHEIVDAAGSRLHLFAPGAGTLRLDYAARVEGAVTGRPVVTAVDDITYQRPSRYCESDVLAPFAVAEFAGLTGWDAVRAVQSWIAGYLTYRPFTSIGTDGATHTLLARAGVCRDYCHLTIAVLRALDVPARMVAMYAPQLDPMDFHAVVEVGVDGEWHVLDPTGLAPVEPMLRIATGRDAADIAFLTTTKGEVYLTRLAVDAQLDEAEQL